MSYLLQFLAGVLVTNGIPHWVQGLSGNPFPSPFATPSGVGDSSPLVNVVWGCANLVGGLVLFCKFATGDMLGWILLALGSLAMGAFCATHFGKVRKR
jgi:hypothetical protein